MWKDKDPDTKTETITPEIIAPETTVDAITETQQETLPAYYKETAMLLNNKTQYYSENLFDLKQETQDKLKNLEIKYIGLDLSNLAERRAFTALLYFVSNNFQDLLKQPAESKTLKIKAKDYWSVCGITTTNTTAKRDIIKALTKLSKLWIGWKNDDATITIGQLFALRITLNNNEESTLTDLTTYIKEFVFTGLSNAFLTRQYYLFDLNEMHRLFAKYPNAPPSLWNGLDYLRLLAKQKQEEHIISETTLIERLHLGKYQKAHKKSLLQKRLKYFLETMKDEEYIINYSVLNGGERGVFYKIILNQSKFLHKLN